jgi:hypothetical protein
MKNGLPITDPTSGYDSIFFWKNRDPRFAATIAYNSCIWAFTGESVTRKQWTYLNNGVEPLSTGAGASNTGFYCRKNVNTTIAKNSTSQVGTDWIEIRLAEVLLNLAECAAELGKIDEAKAELISIRTRAGITAGDGSYGITAATDTAMVEAVMRERQIELAFENKRHWDLRRRNLFINDLGNIKKLDGTRRHGIQVLLDTTYIRTFYPAIKKDSLYTYFARYMRDTISWDKFYNKYFITQYGWERDGIDINYLQPKYNFFYISQDDLNKNVNLQQTINWADADYFDPLAE